MKGTLYMLSAYQADLPPAVFLTAGRTAMKVHVEVGDGWLMVEPIDRIWLASILWRARKLLAASPLLPADLLVRSKINLPLADPTKPPFVDCRT